MSTEEPPLQANGTDTEKTESAQRKPEVMVDPCQDEPTPGPVQAWNSVASFLAEVEPVTAAGVAGVLVIFVLVIFGRIGALVVGFLGGALLHASIDKKKEEAHWKERFTTELTKPEVSKPREVQFTNFRVINTRKYLTTFLQRQIWPYDIFGTSLSEIMSIGGLHLCRTITSSLRLVAISLSILPPPFHLTYNPRLLQTW